MNKRIRWFELLFAWFKQTLDQTVYTHTHTSEISIFQEANVAELYVVDSDL